MGRRGAALGAADADVLALDADAAALARVPDLADHVDRLRQRVDRLAGRQPAAAHRLDRVPEGAGAEAELEPPAGQQVEAGGGAREHGRRAQQEVEDVGEGRSRSVLAATQESSVQVSRKAGW